jgi:hypothetical protein
MNLTQHLTYRHVDQNLHKVWLDDENYRATFPLYNLAGQLMGYQRYFPHGDKKLNNDAKNGKYHTWCPREQGYWGMESFHLTRTLFITEGIFDAARLTECGVSAIAMLSNNPVYLRNWLWTLSQTRPIVAVCDQDAAGVKLAKYGTESYTMQSGKDLGECSEDELEFILEKFV